MKLLEIVEETMKRISQVGSQGNESTGVVTSAEDLESDITGFSPRPSTKLAFDLE